MHDFDFLIGSWKTRNRFLNGRLRGSTDWAEFDSTYDVQRLLGGMGNLGQFRTERDGKKVEGISLRLYKPEASVWAIHWADTVRPGLLLPPMLGMFEGDIGEFHGEEFVDSERVACRFLWNRANRDAPTWEQAFSRDGKNWETNWTMALKRVKA